jgi:ribosome-associated protein
LATPTRERVELVTAAAAEAGALQIVVLDIAKFLPFCDYFVICHGRSPLHCESICDRVEEALRQAGIRPHHREGEPKGDWTILDYDEVVLHVFSEAARRFYDLERLWAEAPRRQVRLAVSSEEAG